MAKNIAEEIWNWGDISIYKHLTGFRCFAVWDGGFNICWCGEQKDAERIAKALVYVAMNSRQLPDVEAKS